MSRTGKCFCGAVSLQVTGEPEGMGYCHCRSCRSWSGGPVNAFTLWRPENVRVTSGVGHLALFQKTLLSQRKYCIKCGGHLMTSHPTLGLVDVFAATLPDLPFKPAVHVNYAETVLPIRDGLPKLRDFPAELGDGARNDWEGRIRVLSAAVRRRGSSSAFIKCAAAPGFSAWLAGGRGSEIDGRLRKWTSSRVHHAT